MTAELAFQVYGIPAPQGSKRHVGHGILKESSKKVAPWRDDVKAAAERQIEAEAHGIWDPFAGPVHVFVVFQFARAAGHYGTGRNAGLLKTTAPRYPMGKTVHGDIEKLARSTFDALSTAGVFLDDKQVVSTQLDKVFAVNGRPGAFIRVTDLDRLNSIVRAAIPIEDVQVSEARL